jgi:methylglyoxal synthase
MIALIAHDQKKGALVDFIRRHLTLFRGHPLVATGSTGRLLSQELGLAIECVAHGPEGGT